MLIPILRIGQRRSLLFVGIGVAALTPLLAFRYFPSVDGPAHVLNASLLTRMLFDHDQQLWAWYRVNPAIAPNWTAHLLLMPLVRLVPGPVAERILIGCFIVSFLGAFRFMLRSVTDDPKGLEFVAFPFLYASHMYWGLFNFCLSLPLLMILIGLSMSSGGRGERGRVALLTALATALYLSHGLTFCFGLIATVLLSACRAGTIRGAIRPAVTAGRAFLPGILLLIQYQVWRERRPEEVIEWATAKYTALNLGLLMPLAPFGGVERIFVAGFALTLYSCCAVRFLQLGRERKRPELLALALLGWVAAFIVPTTMDGGTMITPRLVYLPTFALVAWLAANQLPTSARRVLLVVSVAVAFSVQIVRVPLYRAYSRELDGIISSLEGELEPGKLYLQVPDATMGPFTNVGSNDRPDISPHSLCYLGVRGKGMILTNYEGTQGHFPLLFRRNRDPYRLYFRDRQLQGDALDGSTVGGFSIDGILAWGNCTERQGWQIRSLGDAYKAESIRSNSREVCWLVRNAAPPR